MRHHTWLLKILMFTAYFLLHMLDCKGICCTIWSAWHLLWLTDTNELAHLFSFNSLGSQQNCEGWCKCRFHWLLHFLNAGVSSGQLLEQLRENLGELSSDRVGDTMQPGARHRTSVAVPLSLSFPIMWSPPLQTLLVFYWWYFWSPSTPMNQL